MLLATGSVVDAQTSAPASFTDVVHYAGFTVFTLGQNATDVVTRGWSGQDFTSAFVRQLVSLTTELVTTAEQHLAYPVLHHFRSRERIAAAPSAIARLDEAMLLLSCAVADSARPHASTIDPVRAAIGRYLTTTSMTATVGDPPDEPPAPQRASLQAAGIPTTAQQEYVAAVSRSAERRRRLHRLLHGNGWSWPTT
ncbi:hypothetical protein [Kineococcus arenarius]|uniref:hypothetical protein n=1 Tax=unclassified Kineococcus TaxID=2621656 RepID=UPI003D7DCAE6